MEKKGIVAILIISMLITIQFSGCIEEEEEISVIHQIFRDVIKDKEDADRLYRLMVLVPQNMTVEGEKAIKYATDEDYELAVKSINITIAKKLYDEIKDKKGIEVAERIFHPSVLAGYIHDDELEGINASAPLIIRRAIWLNGEGYVKILRNLNIYDSSASGYFNVTMKIPEKEDLIIPPAVWEYNGTIENKYRQGPWCRVNFNDERWTVNLRVEMSGSDSWTGETGYGNGSVIIWKLPGW